MSSVVRLQQQLRRFSGDSSGSAIFSDRREGFAMYFARLARSLRKDKLIRQGYGLIPNLYRYLQPWRQSSWIQLASGPSIP